MSGPHRTKLPQDGSRVAIAGVGNCASSLVQGVEFYRDADPNERVPGLMHVELGGYHVGDIEFVAAFDVDADKVGLDLGKASSRASTTRSSSPRSPTSACSSSGARRSTVSASSTARSSRSRPAEPVDVAQALRDARADVLVSYLPVGSEDAQKYYAQAALDAGVAFVNAIPVFIASNPEWAKKFEDAGVPIIGDDIKSQVGATITHRLLARLFEDRGLAIDNTYQLNFGGNMDFKNMLERERLLSKKITKTQSVTSQIDQGISSDHVHIGPSDHVPWLNDRKWAYIRLEGRNFGDVPLNIELKLEVWDSPNSAGVIIDAVRCAKVALDRGIGGPLLGPSAYFMKSPPVQYHDDEAHRMVEEFAAGAVTRPESGHDATLRCGIGSPRTARRGDRRRHRQYGAELPTEADLRLCGDVRGKRVLDLGCGAGENAIALARQGAHVIALDASVGAARARPQARRRRPTSASSGTRATSPTSRSCAPTRSTSRSPPASSARSRTSTASSARCTACSAPGAPFVFSFDHPMALAVGRDGDAPGALPLGPLEVRRSYFDRAPSSTTRDDERIQVWPAHDRRRVRGAAPRRLPRRPAARARAAALAPIPGPADPTVDRLAARAKKGV